MYNFIVFCDKSGPYLGGISPYLGGIIMKFHTQCQNQHLFAMSIRTIAHSKQFLKTFSLNKIESCKMILQKNFTVI